MRVVFMGSPQFAVPSLEALMSSKHEVVAIISQPDRPVGRGGKVQFSPVKEFGLKHRIPVLQPERISKEVEVLGPYKPDILVTCAYGQMLRQNVLDFAPHGVINVHGSLLPKYRGASPIQRAIINGEAKTGVTIMRTDIGMDTGDMILWESLDIREDETSGELFPRMAQLGAQLLIEALDLIEMGEAKFIPQDNSQATHAPKLERSHGLIDWSKSAREIVNLVRGLNPWPLAYFEHGGEIIKLHKARMLSEQENPKKGSLLAKTGNGVIELLQLQSPNSRVMSARDWLNGRKNGTPDNFYIV